MAFVTSSTTSFLGQRSLSKSTNPISAPRAVSSAPTMTWGLSGMEKMLAKYERMSTGGPADSRPGPNTPSQPSSVWTAYRDSGLARFAPQRGSFSAVQTYPDMMAAIRRMSYRFVTPGGSPRTSKADAYMAGCVTAQYKSTACAGGVYSVRCTEGTVKNQAEDSRTSALAVEFRMRQRTARQKFGDAFETRRRAIASAHECSYEEKLTGRYVATAAALVVGEAESIGACVRYAVGSDPAEDYMMGCVDKQSKFRAVPYGVYDIGCMDGSAKGLADNKRIVAMSARFRAGQVWSNAKEQAKFDASKYARENFSHMCSYEEELFNKYPAVAGAMRPDSSRY